MAAGQQEANSTQTDNKQQVKTHGSVSEFSITTGILYLVFTPYSPLNKVLFKLTRNHCKVGELYWKQISYPKIASLAGNILHQYFKHCPGSAGSALPRTLTWHSSAPWSCLTRLPKGYSFVLNSLGHVACWRFSQSIQLCMVLNWHLVFFTVSLNSCTTG